MFFIKNKWKMLPVLTIFFLLFITGFSEAHAQDAEINLKDVRVGVYANHPKIYKDADGTIKGFWADITNYIAEKENWNLTYVFGTWEEGLARLEKGEIDIMVDVAVLEDRKKLFDFNGEIALFSWSIFYTRKGFEIKSFEDLEGKNIAIIKTSVHYTAPLGVKNILAGFGVKANIIDVKDFSDVFKMLDTNQADAGVVNWHYGIFNEGNFNIARTGLVFNPSQLNYALTKNGSKTNYLTSLLDFHLRELKDDPNSIYYESIKKNFIKSIGQIEVVPKWLIAVGIATASLFTLFAIGFLLMRQYQKILKRKIDEKVKEIKEAEEKFAAVINQAQDGIIIIQDQIIKYANKAIGIIGYTDTEVVGNSFMKIVAPEEQQRIAENYKRRMAGEKFETIYETKLAHKDGSAVDVEVSAGRIQYQNKPADLVMVRDITARKVAEKSLKEQEAKLATIYNTVASPIFQLSVGKDGRYQFISVNKAFTKVTGLYPDQIIGKFVDQVVPEPSLSIVLGKYEEAIRNKEMVRWEETSNYPSGTLTGEVTIAPVFDEAGNCTYLTGAVLDLTKRKESERKEIELNELRNVFVKVVSHQLRTPLNVIRWNLESLLTSPSFNLADKAKESVRTVYDADVELIGRIDDLLTALDIEEGRLTYLQKTPLSLESLLDSVMVEAKDKCLIKNITFAFAPSASKASFVTQADVEKIRKVFQKIIDNAIIYTKDKGTISASFKEEGENIRFTLTDTGIGVPEAEKKNIFTRFFRASNAFTMQPNASGLGLFIAKYFVEQHGGQIGFDSKEGQGSTFWFELPIAK